MNNIQDVLLGFIKLPGQKDHVFVVVGDGDQQFRVSVVHSGAKVVSFFQGEIIRAAGGDSAFHGGEFFKLALVRTVKILGLNGILNRTRH